MRDATRSFARRCATEGPIGLRGLIGGTAGACEYLELCSRAASAATTWVDTLASGFTMEYVIVPATSSMPSLGVAGGALKSSLPIGGEAGSRLGGNRCDLPIPDTSEFILWRRRSITKLTAPPAAITATSSSAATTPNTTATTAAGDTTGGATAVSTVPLDAVGADVDSAVDGATLGSYV